MFFKKLAAVSIPLFIAGTALANPPPAVGSRRHSRKGDQAARDLVGPARGESVGDLSQRDGGQEGKVRSRERLCALDGDDERDADTKLRSIAEKAGIDIKPLDAQTEEGKSLLDRMKAETALLGSLEGDAFDKEYMTLVTNTQQSVIHVLETNKASAKDPEVKQFLGDMTTTVQNRLKTAQDVMAKIYGDNI